MAVYTHIRHSASIVSFIARETIPALPLSSGSVLVNMMASDDAFEDENCVVSIGYNGSLRCSTAVGGTHHKVGVAIAE